MEKIMTKCALLFFLYGSIFFAMDREKCDSSVDQKLLQIKATKSLFNCESYRDKLIPWSTIMPKKIIVTPDEKGIVMARGNEVLSFIFIDKKTGLQITNYESIIKHSHSQCPPMMVVAETEDKSSIIASAVNYEKPDLDDYYSEYARYH